jgi:hypothetical protein
VLLSVITTLRNVRWHFIFFVFLISLNERGVCLLIIYKKFLSKTYKIFGILLRNVLAKSSNLRLTVFHNENYHHLSTVVYIIMVLVPGDIVIWCKVTRWSLWNPENNCSFIHANMFRKTYFSYDQMTPTC